MELRTVFEETMNINVLLLIAEQTNTIAFGIQNLREIDSRLFLRSLKCISQSQKCDGIINCGYGEDESDCKQLDCDVPDAFQCHKSGKNVCARQAWVCDSRNDCPNNEDEDDALCGDPSYSHPCETGLYCNNQCVLSHQICDGENHCPDGADEENCGCSPEEFSCDADAWPQCIGILKNISKGTLILLQIEVKSVMAKTTVTSTQ